MATRRARTQSETASTRKLIQRVCLSGLSHHAYPLVAKELDAGTPLVLALDRHNAYDKFAIKVLYASDDGMEQVGWIPKGQNEMLAHIIHAGVETSCAIISHDRQQPLDRRLYVAVYITVVPNKE